MFFCILYSNKIVTESIEEIFHLLYFVFFLLLDLDGRSVDDNFPVMKAKSMGNLRDMMLDDDDDDDDDDDEGASNNRDVFDDTASQVSMDYRFSIGELPNWAKAKVNRDIVVYFWGLSFELLKEFPCTFCKQIH